MKPRPAPITVTKGRAVTGREFYDRTEARRGTRLPLDSALAAAQSALEGNLTPGARLPHGSRSEACP